MDSILQRNHLLWRAGFGPSAAQAIPPHTADPRYWLDELWKSSEKAPAPLLVASNAIDGLGNGIGQLGRLNNPNDSTAAAMRRMQMQQSRREVRSLNLLWLDEMVNSQAQLREKMALFWHGFFACRNLNSFFQQQLLQVIRANALGDFGTLLREVSRTPAMLSFLNNQQNRRGRPNENFARELMELFTLGRGNYTETDVKEAARAFTGWGFNLQGEFVFRTLQHDPGIKTVLGRTGNLQGDEVIDILLEKPETARHVCRRFYRYFVSEEVNEQHIQWLATRWQDAGYAMRQLLTDCFTASWFYEPASMGNRIKSPVELLTGLRRQLPMEISNPEAQLLLQRSLGQLLFYPPNVAGWPGGTDWIDGSTLLTRLQLPGWIALGREASIPVKTDDDQEMGRGRMLPPRMRIGASVRRQEVMSPFGGKRDAAWYDALSRHLLQTPHVPPDQLLQPLLPENPEPKHVVVALMSLPEYQLC